MTNPMQSLTATANTAATSLFHYAPEAYLTKILATGGLLPSNAGAPHQRKMLWFSAHQSWEPTATKYVWRDGRVQRQTVQEQYLRQGCIRFALPSTDLRLMEWRSACRAARTTAKERQALEQTGIAWGASPSDWFATTDSIPLGQLQLQVLVGEFGWQDWPIEQAQAHEAHLASLDPKTAMRSHGMAFMTWKAAQANDSSWNVLQRA